jgi:hypothetical protein
VGDAALDSALRQFHDLTVGPYWPAERAIVNAGYAKLEFPFEEVEAPLGEDGSARLVEWPLSVRAGRVRTADR